jgi:hypothetical protein
MDLPLKLSEALDNQSLYNPTSARDRNRADVRGGRRMLDDVDGEEQPIRLADRHSVEARMMDEILFDHKLPSTRNPSRNPRRQSSGSNSSGNDSDDNSVASSASVASSVVSASSAARPRGLKSKDIAGGEDRPKQSPRVRLSQQSSSSSQPSSSSNELLTKMTSRLTRLEMVTTKLKSEAEKKDKTIEKLTKKNKQLEKLVKAADESNTAELLEKSQFDNEELRLEIAEMKTFLQDYGLVWVGHGKHNAAMEAEEQQGERTITPTSLKEKEAVAEPELKFDRDIFVQRVNELNSMIQADKAKVIKEGKNARLEYAQGIPIVLFEDGISVKSGPVRKWDDKKCRSLVADVMDGFFPSEFRAEFPDGVKMDLYDRRESNSGENVRVFAGEGNSMIYGGFEEKIKGLADLGGVDFAPMTAATFLDRLPEKSVGQDGQVYDLRADIAAKLNGAEEIAATGGVDMCTGGDTNINDLKAIKREDALRAAEARMVAASKENKGAEGVVKKARTPQKLNSSLRRPKQQANNLVTGDESDDSECTETGLETTLRVRMADKTLVLKLPYSATVNTLRNHIVNEWNVQGQFEVRTAMPNRSYDDFSETLVDAGLCPNAAVNVRMLKA